ncbi:metaxin-2 [Leptinotarsa decemlineata]|uniref:metaxin-2 n=1 Tax=Leptinotarsa decemlineata TaxID=7539 RepID=UPI003D30886A
MVITRKNETTHSEENSSMDVEIETRASIGLKGVGEMVLDFSITNETVDKTPSFSGVSQDAWQIDTVLFQSHKDRQMILPELANCLAVEAFLRMCDLDYDIEQRSNAEAMSPSLKLPFIKSGRYVIAELENIVSFVNGRGISLTDHLDMDQKANMRAYMSLITNVIELAELYVCWFDEKNYNAVTSVRNGIMYSWPLNHIQNRLKKSMVKKKLKAMEWYQKNIDDVCLDVENCCEALNVRFDQGPYFFGSKPTQLDALVFGHLFAILTVDLPNNILRLIVEKYPELIEFVQKIDKEYFQKLELE